MWKKKRYDIHIRLDKEDLEDWDYAYHLLRRLVEAFMGDANSAKYMQTMERIYWKIHNKCVEINRK